MNFSRGKIYVHYSYRSDLIRKKKATSLLKTLGKIMFFMHNECMKKHGWNQEKNLLLQATRQISFEEIVAALDSGYLIAEVDHPTISNQSIFIIEIDGYPWDVPFVVQEDGSKFLKTAFPNRKRK